MTKEEKDLQEQAKSVLAKMKGEKKLLALHYHPDAIKANIKELKEMADEQPIKDLFEDIGVLVEWALQRLPLVAPPKEKEAEVSEETPTSQNETKK